MRTMLAMTVVVLTAAGCKSQKVISVETEVAAAKARIATLEKRRQELTAESRKLQVERKTFTHQADEAALAKERLVAAGFALQGQPIPDGVLLDEALRAKSATLGELAATIVQRQLPCEEPKDDDATGPDCSPPPLDDSCEGVAARTTQSFSWSCQDLVSSGKTPPTAVCLSSAEVEESAYPLDGPTDHLDADVVRLAFEKAGRLVVADWPPPSLALYTPANWSELQSCEWENGNAQCIRSCDERHGRLHGGCDDWAGDSYDGEGGDESEEPAELRTAREAAAQAERDAAEARDEVSYQECLAQCDTAVRYAEPPPNARISLKYQRAPAPGLFQFDVLQPEDDGGVPAHTLLISFPALHAELAGTAVADDQDTVHDLSTELDVVKIIEGKVNDGQRILAGLTLQGLPVGVQISMDGKTAPLTLDLDEVCAFAVEVKNTKMQERCVVAKAQREEDKVKAAARAAAKYQASLDAGVDAGVSP